jgi:hypothetical protein
MQSSVQRQIRAILKTSDLGQRETALRELARKVGCSLASTYTSEGKHLEEELVRRIQEAAREERDSRLWWLALVSGVASVFSAIAAWLAVWYSRSP